MMAHAAGVVRMRQSTGGLYDTLEARLPAAGYRTTKFQLALDALNSAYGNVSEAKRIAAAHGDRISARTWHKAITARLEQWQ
jgi:hypothetical protein